MREDATTTANVYTVLCEDKVEGKPVQFTLATVEPDNPVWVIDPFSGVVKYDVLLADGTPMFEYSTASNYFLTIVCAQAGFAITATLTIPIQEVPAGPVWVTPIQTFATVVENTLLPTVVFTNSATDPQGLPITYGTYALGTYKNANFKADARGAVFLIPNSNVNASWTSIYYVNELAWNDYATTSISLTISVIGVNHRPRFLNLPNFVQVSQLTSTQIQIFKLSYEDEDDPFLTDSYSFSFLSNPPSGTQKFTIDNVGNVYTFPQPNFDSSTEPTYIMTIFLTDSGNPQLTTTNTLTINIVRFTTTAANSATTVASATTTASTSTTTLSQAIDETTCK